MRRVWESDEATVLPTGSVQVGTFPNQTLRPSLQSLRGLLQEDALLEKAAEL